MVNVVGCTCRLSDVKAIGRDVKRTAMRVETLSGGTIDTELEIIQWYRNKTDQMAPTTDSKLRRQLVWMLTAMSTGR